MFHLAHRAPKVRVPVGAHAVPSVPKERMTIRLFGALLCSGLLVLVASTNSFAQSGRNNTVQGNYIGTSRGFHQSPTDYNADGRRRSNTSDRKYGGGFQGDNDSLRPQDRKANKAGSGIGKPSIFDRWGRNDGGSGRRTNVGVGYPHENTGDGRRRSKSERFSLDFDARTAPGSRQGSGRYIQGGTGGFETSRTR